MTTNRGWRGKLREKPDPWPITILLIVMMADYVELLAAHDRLAAENERLVYALQAIDTWAKAYPVSVFPKMTKEDWKRAHTLLVKAGISLDRISAENMRHILTGVGAIIETAIAAAEGDGK